MTTTDELMRLADAYAKSWLGDMRDDSKARAALETALRDVVQDAARYRWLRDCNIQDHIHDNVYDCVTQALDRGCISLDEAIDAAILKKAGGV